MSHKDWWDIVDYGSDEVVRPQGMEIVASVDFKHPAGFIRLRERHRVKAVQSVTNADDRRCRISTVRIKAS